jgi:hypothetical protein
LLRKIYTPYLLPNLSNARFWDFTPRRAQFSSTLRRKPKITHFTSFLFKFILKLQPRSIREYGFGNSYVQVVIKIPAFEMSRRVDNKLGELPAIRTSCAEASAEGLACHSLL